MEEFILFCRESEKRGGGEKAAIREGESDRDWTLQATTVHPHLRHLACLTAPVPLALLHVGGDGKMPRPWLATAKYTLEERGKDTNQTACCVKLVLQLPRGEFRDHCHAVLAPKAGRLYMELLVPLLDKGCDIYRAMDHLQRLLEPYVSRPAVVDASSACVVAWWRNAVHEWDDIRAGATLLG